MIADSSFWFYALLPAAGFITGVFGSFTGLGGAIILNPMLILVFGLPPNVAVGCGMAQMIGMAFSGLTRHYRLGHVNLRLAVNFILGSIPGAVLGRLLLHEITFRYGASPYFRISFNSFYALFLAIGACTLLVRLWRFKKTGKSRADEDSGTSRLQNISGRYVVVWMAGLAAGLMGGLLAVGGGMVTVPVLSGVLGAPIQTAVGTSIFQMVPMALAATLVSLGTPDLRWPVIGLLLAGSVPGAMIGPRLLQKAVAKVKGNAVPGEK